MELLSALEDEFCFSMIHHKMILEMVPSPKDGCEIFLTKTEKQPKNEEHLIITSFVKSEDAFYAKNLSKKYLQTTTAVYLMHNEYYLVIYSKEQSDLSKVRTLLSDFGESIQYPALMESVLKEYGTLIFRSVFIINRSL